MAKKLLLILPADKLWGRVVRRGVVVAVLTFISIIIKDLVVPNSPEVWVAILTGVLLLVDKTIREMLAGTKIE